MISHLTTVRKQVDKTLLRLELRERDDSVPIHGIYKS